MRMLELFQVSEAIILMLFQNYIAISHIDYYQLLSTLIKFISNYSNIKYQILNINYDMSCHVISYHFISSNYTITNIFRYSRVRKPID